MTGSVKNFLLFFADEVLTDEDKTNFSVELKGEKCLTLRYRNNDLSRVVFVYDKTKPSSSKLQWYAMMEHSAEVERIFNKASELMKSF